MSAKDDVDINALGQVIASDQAMASKLLQLANSAEFAPHRTISKVPDAIIYVWLKEARKVIFLVMAHSAFLGIQDQETWFRAVTTAHIAQELANGHSASVNIYEAFMAGILANVGRTYMMIKKAAEYKVVMNRVEMGTNLIKAEKDMFGIDHAEVGAMMANRWNLPERIVQAIQNHHASGSVPDPLDRVVILATQLAGSTGKPDPESGPVNERLMQSLSVTPESAQKIIELCRGRVDDFLNTLYHIF